MQWTTEVPTIKDLSSLGSEEYYWVKGGNFNRELIVQANKGVSSWVNEDGQRAYFSALNFNFFCEGMYEVTIWDYELKDGKYPFLYDLQWAGPVTREYE